MEFLIGTKYSDNQIIRIKNSDLGIGGRLLEEFFFKAMFS